LARARTAAIQVRAMLRAELLLRPRLRLHLILLLRPLLKLLAQSRFFLMETVVVTAAEVMMP
jgi:hypothetical protein